MCVVECTLIKVFCLIISEAFPRDLGINLISAILHFDSTKMHYLTEFLLTVVSKQNRKFSYFKQDETRFNGPFET